MNNATAYEPAVDLLALFAEVDADQAANPEKWARLAAEADAPARAAAKRHDPATRCGRCGGSGKHGPYHVLRGTCFDCGGSGVAF